MRELKIFIVMFCILILLYLSITGKFILLSSIVFAFFVCKCLYLQNIITDYSNLTKKALRSQREYFINSLCHDLRIPIIAQLRMLEFINNEKLGYLNESQKEMLSQTEQSCKCILNLISLLINTYNIENSTYCLIYDKFNLYETILSCIDELVLKASEKNITFEYDCIDKNIYLFADREEIKKVINNLLIASIDYSNTGGVIFVKLENIDKKLKLSVKVEENICVKNEPVKFDSRYTAIGENIRLHFCKKIIELHKGKIIQNDAKLKTFVLELPLSA